MNSNYYITNNSKPTLPKLVSDPTAFVAPTPKMSVKKHSIKKDEVPVFLQKVRSKRWRRIVVTIDCSLLPVTRVLSALLVHCCHYFMRCRNFVLTPPTIFDTADLSYDQRI